MIHHNVKSEKMNEKTKKIIKNKKNLVLHNPSEEELKEFLRNGFIIKSMKFNGDYSVDGYYNVGQIIIKLIRKE